MKRLALLVVLVLVAGCGSGGGDGGGGKPGRAFYSAGGWTITLDHGKPTLYHYVGNKWVVDRSRAVKIEILGPDPNQVAPNPPQIAIAMRAKQALMDYATWIDDLRIFEKGGGSPTNYTIYGAPANPLDPGTHTAVGYARTASGGTVVAWTFTVK
jgi:hypothetical protein